MGIDTVIGQWAVQGFGVRLWGAGLILSSQLIDESSTISKYFIDLFPIEIYAKTWNIDRDYLASWSYSMH
jgi:hypothetical protein